MGNVSVHQRKKRQTDSSLVLQILEKPRHTKLLTHNRSRLPLTRELKGIEVRFYLSVHSGSTKISGGQSIDQ